MPNLLTKSFSRLEGYGFGASVTIEEHHITAKDKAALASLVREGCIHTDVTPPKCSGCDTASYAIKGSKTEYVCEQCGNVFTCYNLPKTYSMNAQSIATWLASQLGFEDAPEKEQDGLYYLGDLDRDGEKFEIYFSNTDTSRMTALYNYLAQQVTNTAIVLSIASNPSVPEKNLQKKIKAVSLRSCLAYEGDSLSLRWASNTFMVKDYQKVVAGKIRQANSPTGLAKKHLKNMIKRNHVEQFLHMQHHEVKAKIYSQFPEWTVYHDDNKNIKHLADKTIITAIKEVIREENLPITISGI